MEVTQLRPTAASLVPAEVLQANCVKGTAVVVIPTEMLAIEPVVLAEQVQAMVVLEPKQAQRTCSCDDFSWLVMLFEVERLSESEPMEL